MFALDVQHLNKTYSSGTNALSDVCLQIQPGEFVGLLGPNGAGKTSLIGIINTLTKKTSGHVSAFGHNLDTDAAGLKSCVGTVPQEFNFSIFDRVWDIVYLQAGYFGLSPRVARERTDFYLKKVGLWSKKDAISRSLSGGMKRRLMIARALVHQPRLLILDEPTAGVDVEMRQSMWQFLTELNQQGVSILLTTHYLEEAEQLCDRIAILHDGQIIRDAAKHDLVQELSEQSYLLDVQRDLPAMAAQPYSITVVEPGRIKVKLSQGQELNELFDYLSQQQVHVSSIERETGRLEELFVNLTAQQGE